MSRLQSHLGTGPKGINKIQYGGFRFGITIVVYIMKTPLTQSLDLAGILTVLTHIFPNPLTLNRKNLRYANPPAKQTKIRSWSPLSSAVYWMPLFRLALFGVDCAPPVSEHRILEQATQPNHHRTTDDIAADVIGPPCANTLVYCTRSALSTLYDRSRHLQDCVDLDQCSYKHWSWHPENLRRLQLCA